jgi:signal transduction histidine kinase
MKVANLPENEAERLQALIEYEVLDTAEELNFDELTELASSICQKPIALISLIDSDRQWFKSHHGLDARETPRDYAFCAHAILDDGIFEICDSTQDERFNDNPLVVGAPDVIFYAGAPLQTPSGHNIGTLCVIDNKPGKLSEQQRRQLRLIGNQVIAQLELREASGTKTALLEELKISANKLSQQNQELYQFAHRVAHDLNSPLTNIQSFVDLSLHDLEKGENDKAIVKYDYIKNASNKARQLIGDLLELTRAELSNERLQVVDLNNLLSDVVDNINSTIENNPINIDYEVKVSSEFVSEPTRLQQIFYNLLSNSVKYYDTKKAKPFAKIIVESSGQNISVRVQDNGLGIPEKYQHKIFDTFTRFHVGVASGSGIGTTIVKKHIDALGGTINLNSSKQLTEFLIELPNRLR